ncbi:Vinorine synthase [Morus notabilis]|uniref:Vinorine synthase n=1 Tax=Morus notabilis TaxID=981085 RepID=W9RKF8_9ROSA|nr:vinorine synthase [Morus notabilis]EXB82430.1 Vinorine synthase [Morus notabilis]
MEVEVTSNKIIKPSSPTPENLRRYKLSFLDQLSPKAYGPLLYYYALNDHTINEPNYISKISNKLKKSLSQALTLYYPLAGRFIDDRFLDCNDDGVPYFEARVKTKLSDVHENWIPCELNKLLPFELDEIAELPLGVQLNVFECGGIAIGICLSHRLEDALSCLVFVKSWMAIARGENDTVARPEFISGDLFPPRNMGGHDPTLAIKKNMCTTNITKRFVFEARKIEALRSKYEETKREEGIIKNHNVVWKRPRLSRISALSAFLWSRYMAATKSLEAEAGKNYVILHPVNIRPRCDPPLGEHSFGNYYTTAATVGTITSTCTGDEYCYGLARKIGEEIRKIDKEFVKNNIQETGDELVEIIKKETERLIKGEVIGVVITSLCRFPLYEADFGYGKPTWVSSAARGFINLFAFMDNKAGDGIEAYICLNADDMAKLEVDKEFLAFVSPDVAALDEFTILNGA